MANGASRNPQMILVSQGETRPGIKNGQCWVILLAPPPVPNLKFNTEIP